MARVTVEDCLNVIPNRFILTLVAAKRARILANEGVTPYVPLEQDKVTVLALREIAEGFIDSSILDPVEKENKVPVKDMEEIAAEIAQEMANIDSVSKNVVEIVADEGKIIDNYEGTSEEE